MRATHACPEARLLAVLEKPSGHPEHWLQVYFHLIPRHEALPIDATLIAFEETPDGSIHTQQGVCDLVYRDGRGQLYIVETKIIDSKRGRTACSRRTRKRKTIRGQLDRYAQLFAHRGSGQDPVQIAMTTDPNPSQMPGPHYRVGNHDLGDWIAEQAC